MKSPPRSRLVAGILAAVLLLLLAGVLLFHNALARGFFSVAKGCVGRNDRAAAARWTGYAIHFASGELRLDLHESRITYLMGAGNPKGALEEVDRLLERDPTARGGRIRLQRGDVLKHLGRFEEARAEAVKVQGKLDPPCDLEVFASSMALAAEVSEAEGSWLLAYIEHMQVVVFAGERSERGMRSRKAATRLRKEHPEDFKEVPPEEDP